MKLDEFDRRLLALLGTRTWAPGDLADDLGVSPSDLEGWLDDLADDGLVVGRGDGRYERTESGRRVLVAAGTGAVDERVDTTPEVEAAIDAADLRPDEADAVRHAFSLLRYWGNVTEAEIQDAIFSEAPAGRETAAAWWEEVIRGPLATLPGVEAPTVGDGGVDGPAVSDEPWRYDGPPEAGERDVDDGRRVLSRLHPVYGDVKHALESLDLSTDEREAARAAFGYLYRRGEATEGEIGAAVFPDHPAGYDSPGAWWDGFVRHVFEALPGVERPPGGDQAGTTWRYRRP